MTSPILLDLLDHPCSTSRQIAERIGDTVEHVERRLHAFRIRGSVTSERGQYRLLWSAVPDSVAIRRHRVYAAIRAALASGPLTTQAVADAAGLPRVAAYGRLCTMERAGDVVAQIDWAIDASARWALPEHADLLPPGRAQRGDIRRAVLASIAQAPATADELAARLGLTKQTAAAAARSLDRSDLVDSEPVRAGRRGRPVKRYEVTYIGRRELRSGGTP